MSEQRYPQRAWSRPEDAVEIVLVRHGASAEAVAGEPFELVEGHADPPLAPEGERQAREVAECLAGRRLDGLFVTTLRRTAQTAAPLARRTGLTPVVVPELREVRLGDLEGAAFRIALAEGDPRVAAVFAQERWDAIPGAEGMEALAQRTRAGIDAIAGGLSPGATVVAVVHGGVIGELCRQATGSRRFAFVHADNGSMTRLVILGDGRWRVAGFNDVSHLSARGRA